MPRTAKSIWHYKAKYRPTAAPGTKTHTIDIEATAAKMRADIAQRRADLQLRDKDNEQDQKTKEGPKDRSR